MPRNIEQLVSEQVRRAEIAREQAAETGGPYTRPVVSISRGMGSGARVIAGKLAEELGWSLWDKNMLDAIAENAHVSRRVVEAFDEKTVSEIEVLVKAVFGDHETGGFVYARHLARAVAAVATLGNAIILGRGANLLLPDALSIRIDASDERRVQNMMSYESLTRDEAVAKIRKSDKERRSFLVNTFGKERVEHVCYDLTIWMDKFGTEGAVGIIKAAIAAKYEGIPQ